MAFDLETQTDSVLDAPDDFAEDFKFSKYFDQVQDAEPIMYVGYVTAVNGLEILSRGPIAQVGEICTIKLDKKRSILAEVVGLDDKIVKLTAYAETTGIEVGCEVIGSGKTLQVPVGMSLLGRTIDATGKPCDGLGEIVPETYYPAVAPAPDAMTKLEINRRITTGVRAIDSSSSFLPHDKYAYTILPKGVP